MLCYVDALLDITPFITLTAFCSAFLFVNGLSASIPRTDRTNYLGPDSLNTVYGDITQILELDHLTLARPSRYLFKEKYNLILYYWQRGLSSLALSSLSIYRAFIPGPL